MLMPDTMIDTRDGLSTFDADQRLTACNIIYRQMYGLPERFAQPGTPLIEIVRYFLENETGRADPEAVRNAGEWIARHLELLALGKSSTYIHFLSDGRAILVRDHPLVEGGWAEVHEDITDKCRADAQILHLGRYHDLTTDRLVIDERLRAALSRAARGERFALLFLEVDTFKAFNDRFGSPIEDEHLRQALAAEEFELKYQPIINLARSQIVSSEALIRWRKPGVGLVLPAEFIPLAEETGLIVALGDWVLKQACSTAATWPDNIRVAVNVSARQLKTPGFIGTITGALEHSGLSASRLELEISESTLLNGDKATLETLCEVRGVGARIVLENFGADYSSLDDLMRLPVDVIKIDPSLTNSVATDNSSDEIFRAVVMFARSVTKTTTVKGVESEEQLRLARDVGCDEAQGYFICPPLPAEGADCAWQLDARAGYGVARPARGARATVQ
jgi:EAL domain-containing protein (putative c-di-GMP-specific phosphodiesterase class I)